MAISRLLPLRFGREDIYTKYLLEKVTSGSEDKHARSGMIWVLNIWFWTGVERT